MSYILWQTERQHKTIGKAVSKYILDNYEKLEASNEIYYPLTRKLGGEVIPFHNKEEFQRFLKSEESLYAWGEGTDLNIMSSLFKVQINVLVSKNGKLDGGKPIVFGEKYSRKAVLLHNVEEEHYYAVVAPDNPNKNFTLLNNVKRYVEGHEELRKSVQKNVSVRDDHKDEKDKIDSLMLRLGVLESRMNFYEAEKKRNDDEKRKLREEVNSLKENVCSHQSVVQNPVRPANDQSNFFPQPGQVTPPPVAVMDTSEKDEIDDLKRLKAMKDQGFRRDTPQSKPVGRPIVKKPSFYCISCDVPFDTKEALKEHNKVCQKKKIPDFEPIKPPEKVFNIPVLQSNVNVKALHPGFVPRQYNCLDCGFQSSGSGRSKMLLRHAKETGHKTDDLSEKCFTCGTVSKNFVELMIHRKAYHGDIVQKCHYNQDCQFKEKCWYNHDAVSSPSQVNNRVQGGFQQAKESLPPDQIVLLKELLTLFQQTKENRQGKSPGV